LKNISPNLLSLVQKLTATDLSLILLFELIGSVQIEVRRRSFVLSPKLAVAPIADGDISKAAIDNQIYQSGAGENAIRNQILTKPVEDAADHRADDDDRQTQRGIEVLAYVEVVSCANRTDVDPGIGAQGLGKREPNDMTAAAASDRLWGFDSADGQP
jgi:hypothetical protein